MISFPPFRLDLRDERLWKSGKEIPLRRKPFAILKHLLGNPQRLVSHAELVEVLWGKMAVSESLLRTHMHDLRRALGEGVIETVVGRGYRFLPAVQYCEAHADDEGSSTANAPVTLSVVGRDVELALLHSAWRGARGRKRSVVFVSGDPGLGKTALLEAFVEQARREGPAWIARGVCVERHGSGDAYLPVLDALGGLCRGPGHERIVDLLKRHAPTWLAQMPSLVGLPHADQTERYAKAAEPGLLHELAEALDALSADAPVVFVLDDLQWADPSAIDLLAVLARRLQPARLLVVGAYRRGALTRSHPLTRTIGELVAHRQATEVELEGFDDSALEAYLASRYGDHLFPAALVATLHRATGGNPLFLSALVDDLEACAMIRRVDGDWMLNGRVDDVAARRPEGIRRLVDAQIDRLDLSSQRILEAASVAGQTFSAGVVAHVLDANVDEIDSSCENLANEHRLLRPIGTEMWPDGSVQSRYAFAHPVLHHAARARCASVAARAWHRRIAERLEAAYGERAEEIAPELATHFEHAQNVPKAFALHVVAGERALQRQAPSEALAHFGTAHRLRAAIPENGRADDLELRVLVGLGASALAVEDVSAPEILSALDRAVALAAKLGDDARRRAALAARQGLLRLAGDVRAASEQGNALESLGGAFRGASATAA